MTTTANTPVAREIGRATVERIEILRARGLTASQVADDLDLDVYVVEEAFAWHDLLCNAGERQAARSFPRCSRMAG